MLPKKAAAAKGGAKPMTKGAIDKAIADEFEIKTKVAATIMNVIVETGAKEAEGCDYLQDFQMCHSLGGGTALVWARFSSPRRASISKVSRCAIPSEAARAPI